jgi:hypothetical protein
MVTGPADSAGHRAWPTRLTVAAIAGSAGRCRVGGLVPGGVAGWCLAVSRALMERFKYVL